MSKFLIYALVDPRDGAWRYIGKSCSGLRRPKAHASPSRLTSSPHKCNWIRQLKALDLQFDIQILEEFPSFDGLDAAEIAWIAEARRAGIDLTNYDDGGTGRTPGFTISDETRAKMSAASLGKPKAPAHRAKLAVNTKRLGMLNIGRRHSDGTKAKQSAAHLGYVPSEITREKLRVASTGRRHTPEALGKISEHAQARAKPIFDQNGIKYSSQLDAARKLDLHQAAIQRVLKGTQKQTEGFTFSYSEAA